MQLRENFTMENNNARHSDCENRSKFLVTRTTFFLFVSIFICSLIAVGLLVYNFAVCPNLEDNICDNHTYYHLSAHPYPPEISASSMSTSSLTLPTTKMPATQTGSKDIVDVRLPRSIKPITYKVKLVPFLIIDNFTFNGEVDIRFQVLEDCNNITLHAFQLKIDEKDVSVSAESNNEALTITKQYFVEEKQFFIVKLKETLMKGSYYTITIKYVGILNDNLQGFYRSSYMVGNELRWLATTQFQPTDCRRAIPSFDEPALKAKFKIIIARPSHLISISNMPRVQDLEESSKLPKIDNYVWDVYEESVPISTYLVAFVVSDFVNKTSGNFAVWTRADTIKSADYALQIGPKILQYFEEFFYIKYPLPKMDMIALPDFSAGAMENWGLITYRETAMLFDEGISASANKQRVASVVAHEISHQWFGNLVTPSWWTDLWLNEGFASYMEYIGVDSVEPSWKSMDQFVINEVHNVFALDALSSSHQISVKVENPDEINDIFDRISYGKGATIIRMMDHFLTSKVFTGGLTNYLRDRAMQAAEQDDLWQTLTDEARNSGIFDSTQSVKEIMDTWTLQTGFPVVTVKRDYKNNKIELEQERFILMAPSTNLSLISEIKKPIWWVPITYTSKSRMNFNETKPKHWMKAQKKLTIEDNFPMSDWIIVNLQQTGYYRVNYDENNWKLIQGHLRDEKRFSQIVPPNRAQIVDDALNLARAGYLDYSVALDITQYLRHEVDYVPWKSALNAMNFIDSMLLRSSDYYKFKEYFLYLLENVYKEVGFEDKKSSSLLMVYKRVDILVAACHLGLKDCVDNCVRKYHTWIHESIHQNNPISPNLKSLVYCNAIKYGDQTEWEFAWEQFQKTSVPSEKEILLSALGCSREPWILRRFLERALTDEFGIRKQDVFRVFAAISNNVQGQPIAFDFIRDNWQKLKDYMGSSMSNLNAILKFSTRRINNVHKLNEVKEFASLNLKDSGRTIQQIIEEAESNIMWMHKNYENIVNWLGNATNKSV